MSNYRKAEPFRVKWDELLFLTALVAVSALLGALLAH
jgi:hypothetical protein